MEKRTALYTPAIEGRGVRIERRAGEDGQDEQKVVVGYAAVFYDTRDEGTVYKPWDDLHERILPGAFDRAIREKQDVRGLFNHIPSNILGRTKSGTARLSVDAVGLRYEIDLPDNTCGRDLEVSVNRGDIDGSSFSFIPQRAVWREEGDVLIREIEDVDLFDVGPVTYPAYQSTTAGMRGEDGFLELQAEAARYLKQRTATVDVEFRYRERRHRQNRS